MRGRGGEGRNHRMRGGGRLPSTNSDSQTQFPAGQAALVVRSHALLCSMHAALLPSHNLGGRECRLQYSGRSCCTAGVALNLTAASHCFLMDPWWNPAVEQQVWGGRQ